VDASFGSFLRAEENEQNIGSLGGSTPLLVLILGVSEKRTNHWEPWELDAYSPDAIG
jgi:hypothetical protein